MTVGTHRYYLKANDAAGNTSFRSGIRTIEFAGGTQDTERPSAPGSPNDVGQTSDTLALSWNPATDNIGVTSYDLYDADTNTVVATSTTTDLTLTAMTVGTHRYYLKANDAAGNTSFRSGIRTIEFAGGTQDTERPSTASGLVGTSNLPGKVDLDWNDSIDNVAVTGYNIYDAPTGQIIAISPDSESVLTGLDPGDRTFYVRAFDEAGNISWRSNTRTVTIG